MTPTSAPLPPQNRAAPRRLAVRVALSADEFEHVQREAVARGYSAASLFRITYFGRNSKTHVTHRPHADVAALGAVMGQLALVAEELCRLNRTAREHGHQPNAVSNGTMSHFQNDAGGAVFFPSAGLMELTANACRRLTETTSQIEAAILVKPVLLRLAQKK